MLRSLKTVNLNIFLGQLQLGDQEFANLDSLVSLQLNHVTELLIFDNVTITSKVLFQNLQNSLQVKLLRDTLYSSQRLTSITLLDTNMDVVCWLVFCITSVGERIYLC